MTIRFTARQVAQMLRILTPTIRELDRVAAAMGEDSWEVESMAHGRTAPSAKVLRYLELSKSGAGFVGRVE